MVLIKVLLIWFFLRLYWFVGTVEHAKTGVSSCAYIVEVYSNMDVCIAGAGDDPLGRFEKKLGVVKAYTRSVVSGDHTSLYLSGPGGTSKSWTVEEVIEHEYGLIKDRDYYWHRGRISMGGLLDVLLTYAGSEDSPQVIVFDDGQEIMHDRRCESILLAALGRQKGNARGRRVLYKTQKQQFDFVLHSGIIVITNEAFGGGDRVKDAIGTRLLFAEFDPADAEIEAKAFDIIRTKADLGVSIEEAEEVAAYCFARCREKGVSSHASIDFRLRPPSFSQWSWPGLA